MSHATFVDQEIAALMRGGLYRSREEVISDAVRNLPLKQSDFAVGTHRSICSRPTRFR